jgi:hypothetical protein
MSEFKETDGINWSLTTYEGARREQMRRWSRLSLRDILLAQEEMQKLADFFHRGEQQTTASTVTAAPGHEHLPNQNHY